MPPQPTASSKPDKLTAQMGEPNFWDNSEKAQQIIQQLKPINGLLKPFVHVRFHHPTPSNCPALMCARSMSAW